MKFSGNGTAAYADSEFDWKPIKFNAKKKTFVGSSHIKLKSGHEEISPLVSENQGTSIGRLEKEVGRVKENLAKDATRIVSKNAWDSLPTYANYNNIDELYDADEIEELYMQSAKKRGW